MQAILLFQFLAFAVAQQSGVHLTVLPTESPMVTRPDTWHCATNDIVGYFEPPWPTAALNSAREDYAGSIQPCTVTNIEEPCPFPEKSLWCGFSTAVPSTLLDEYVAYGSTASSWWGARSSAAVSIAGACPHSWWLAKENMFLGAYILNLTIIEAECYAEAHPTPSDATPSSTISTANAFAATGPTATPAPTQAPDSENAGFKRAETPAWWYAAGTGLAAGAINSIF